MIICEKAKWCIEQHSKTNHLYDDYLPYEYHLRSVVHEYERYKHLIPDELREDIRIAVWGHDTIEDTRKTYNDVKQALGERPADIIYAVSNEKGKKRKERANDKYYEGIRETSGAVFVKLCDRIANVKYGIHTNGRMLDGYRKENPDFLKQLAVPDRYREMVEDLLDLLK